MANNEQQNQRGAQPQPGQQNQQRSGQQNNQQGGQQNADRNANNQNKSR